MRRLWLVIAATGAVCVPPGLALAASGGYRLHVTVPRSVGRGQAFKVTGSGFAKKRLRLVFFLAQQPCSSSYVIEYNNLGAWQVGDSYFRRGRGKGSKSLTSRAYEVHGSFKVTVTAYGGSQAGTEYVCAYLPSRDPTVTRAHASATYRVR